MKPWSRRWRYRYARKQTREEGSALEKHIEVNKVDLEKQRCQILWSVQEKAKESYFFLPDEQRSAKQNALIILTNMQKWFYFCQPTNIAFHDLTIVKVAQKVLQSLLGLGLKYCPTPLCPTLSINNSMEQFDRELHIWSVFSGSKDLMPLANPKIYIKSKWKPK